MIQSYLIRGNALAPAPDDLLGVIDRLPTGEPVPDGWRVTSGNLHSSEIVWIGMRREMDLGSEVRVSPEASAALRQAVHEIEAQVIELLLVGILRDADALISVDDGEEITAAANTRDVQAICEEIGASDVTYLHVTSARNSSLTLGRFMLIHGNLASVISDYTDNEWAASAINAANALANRLD